MSSVSTDDTECQPFQLLPDTAESLLDQLAENSRQTESHRAAIWRLRLDRQRLYAELKSAGWRSPEPK